MLVIYKNFYIIFSVFMYSFKYRFQLYIWRPNVTGPGVNTIHAKLRFFFICENDFM
jgi:hypothetical protein